jgi:hypothetical protein
MSREQPNATAASHGLNCMTATASGVGPGAIVIAFRAMPATIDNPQTTRVRTWLEDIGKTAEHSKGVA